jgi:hypothetical protein
MFSGACCLRKGVDQLPACSRVVFTYVLASGGIRATRKLSGGPAADITS